mmetsp:Transcript_9374/g.30840  ORF Transcript_9374/g.30840 Transcript_9374/m.30840 type:complete len:197 (+) Transcript_9374:134-724(+)
MGDSNVASQRSFLGVKERRRLSIEQVPLGDAADLTSNEGAQRALAKHGDTAVLFSDVVFKVGRRGDMKERVVAVTHTSLYLFDAGTCRVRRRIPLQGVSTASLSDMPDNFLLLEVPAEHDLLLVTPRKVEAVVVLQGAVAEAAGRDLEVRFANVLRYRAGADLEREVRFARAPDGGVTTAFSTVSHRGSNGSGEVV